VTEGSHRIRRPMALLVIVIFQSIMKCLNLSYGDVSLYCMITTFSPQVMRNNINSDDLTYLKNNFV